MHAYIKTPFYRNSKYIPHLLEHCVNSRGNLNSNDFFSYVYQSDADTFSWYTHFSFSDKISIEVFISWLQKDLDAGLIEYEKQILKDELKDVNFAQELFEKIWKRLHWIDFNNNHISRVSTIEIVDYHKKYYKSAEIIICDDSFNIISPTKKFTEAAALNDNTSPSIIKVRGESMRVFIRTYASWKDYYFMLFIQELLKSFQEYTERHKKWVYYFDNRVFLFRTEKYSILSFPEYFECNISIEFFDSFKTYFLTRILSWYWKKWIPINLTLLNQYAKMSEVIDFCNGFKFEEPLSFLWND